MSVSVHDVLDGLSSTALDERDGKYSAMLKEFRDHEHDVTVEGGELTPSLKVGAR